MVDKVMDFGKKLLERIKEWWNKFQPKQKTLIIGIAVVILLAIAILVAVLTKKQYVKDFVVCESTKEAASVKALLDGQGIIYDISSDGLRFDVLESQQSDANLLLGANNIPTAAYTMDDVLNGSFSTTEADKQKRYKLYLETQIEEDIKNMKAVKTASCQLTIPDDNGTLIAQNLETYASIFVELEDGASFTEENAAAIARMVATGLGNATTDNVAITDTDGKTWFPVEQTYSTIEKADNMMMLKQEAESLIKNEVRQVLFGTNQFNQIEVAINAAMDFSQKKITRHNYSTPDANHDQGLLASEEVYQSSATDGVGGVPGTDSNSETDMMISEQEGTNSSSYERKSKYLPNEEIIEEIGATGTVVYNDSTVSVAAVRYRVVREEDVRLQGLLDGITWEEYKLANNEKTKLEVDEDFVSMVANATGIPSKNVSFVAFEEVQFIDEMQEAVVVKDIVQIVLIIIILTLLAFVVIMSLRTKKEVEEEEELAVEDLLQSNVEELEGIETEQKSEARKLIENFVEENPEAVATLLRNWLDEDWG
ncbi:MAG: flagellar M-ring protein FliF [Lachnospiraceae bacterium]|nr:flagellar M-ring protein FliF [Lachnospiraceae bacterium]